MAHVHEANPDVQDALDVAATVESLGWTDSRVEDVFGFATVFDLAEDMLVDIRSRVWMRPLPTRVERTLGEILRQALDELWNGMTFALPMVVSVVSMIFLHISFASYLYFSVEQATALALATFLSFVLTGGITQAMANSYYILTGLGEAEEVEPTLFLFMRWGISAAIVVCALIVFLDSLFPLFPLPIVLFMSIYTVTLSMLWLACATLYVLRRVYILTVVYAIAIAIAYLTWQHGYPVVIGQMVGMVVATVISTGSATLIYRRVRRTMYEEGRILKTRISQLAYAASPYFTYGTLYFIFIFADRLVSWSTNTTYMPYTIWFRGPYELGMDWALGALIVPLAMSELMIGVLMRWIIEHQQSNPEREVARMGSELRVVYLRVIAIFIAAAIAGVLVSHVIAALAATSPSARAVAPISSIESFTFTWASISYVLVAASLFNVLFLFTISLPAPALRQVGIAIAIDLGVGLVLTRILGQYQDAVYGLIAGAIYLGLATTFEVIHALPQVDFLLYRIS